MRLNIQLDNIGCVILHQQFAPGIAVSTASERFDDVSTQALIPVIVPYEKIDFHAPVSELKLELSGLIDGSKTTVTIESFAHTSDAKIGVKNAKTAKIAKYNDFFMIKTPQISNTYIMKKTYVFDIVVKLKNKN